MEIYDLSILSQKKDKQGGMISAARTGLLFVSRALVALWYNY